VKAVALKSGDEVRVARLCARGGAGSDSALAFWHGTMNSGHTYQSVDELFGAAAAPDAIVLDSNNAQLVTAWLEALRRKPGIGLLPVLTGRDLGAVTTALADGVARGPEDVEAAIRRIDERLLQLPERAPVDPEEQLLAFLYLRPEYQLKPISHWRFEHLYRYPLINALATSGQPPATEWLARMRKRGLLEVVDLVDRTRHCPKCDGGHLSFVDVCPECRHVDITESTFFHCFACGHVADQKAFYSGDSLSCPKCSIRLRHIGVDYDRALESFGCEACNARFIEPEVRARCLHCGSVENVDALTEHRWESLRIAEAGKLAARTGSTSGLFDMLDGLNYAHPAYFEQTLDWLEGLAARHDEAEFGLIVLRLDNLRQLIDEISRPGVEQLVAAFAARLRELLRTTDLVMRSDDQHCWILLPHTSADSTQLLVGRINELPAATRQPSGGQVAITCRSLSSRALSGRRRGGTAILAELQATLGQAP
jgi:GGDEF domain-containing protein